jgi:hypothetical protein
MIRSMKLLPFPLLLLAALLLHGCASAPRQRVELFRDGETPSRPFREISLFTDDGTLAEQGEIEQKMIKAARRAGADALIFEKLVRTGEELRGFGLATTYLYKARAVIYNDSDR